MKQIIKKSGLILLSAVFLCGTASCGKEEAVQVTESPQKDPEYLSFFSLDSMSGSSVAKYWSEHFAKEYNRDIYIEFDGATYYSEQGLSYREILEKRLKSSAPDDLYIINAEDVMTFDKKGYWMDLADTDAADNLTDAALYQSTYDGKVFSIPLSFTGFGFYWNMDLLKENGLSVPGNLEEFLNVCEILKSKGIMPYGANKGYSLTVPAMCAGMADLYRDEDSRQRIEELNSGSTPISTYMRKGYEFLAMMIEKGYMDKEQALNTLPGEEREGLLKGEYAFICAGLEATDLAEKSGTKPEIKMTGLPVLNEGCITVYGAANRLCVNPKSQHLDTALDFIEMVGTKEALDQSAEFVGSMSSAKGSKITTYPMQEEMCELLQQPGQIPNQDFSLHFNTWENIRDISRELCGGISVDEACRMLDEKQSEELQKYESNVASQTGE